MALSFGWAVSNTSRFVSRLSHMMGKGGKGAHMRAGMSIAGRWIAVMVLGTALTQAACQRGSEPEPGDPPIAPVEAETVSVADVPAPPAGTPELTGTSSVMVYINMTLEKKYGLLARVVGGKKDSVEESEAYSPDNPWWINPLVVYADPPLPDPDVTGRADGRPIMSGRGVSKNVSVHVKLIPHADVVVKTDPRSDGIRGTITVTISAVAEFYDGGWVEMVREDDRKLTFGFDTCDPSRHLEAIGHETRTISTFLLERYTRDKEKWEPKNAWPDEPESGDWRVGIYGKNATLQVTAYHYVDR